MVEAERVYRVAIFGIIGSGKSSIINLLAGKQVADISTNVEPCTRRARWYPILLEKKNFRLWDTMGFNPVGTKDLDPLSPYEQAHALLRNLPKGIDLILLCAQTNRTDSLRKLYWLLNETFFGGQVQIALVLTHLDAVPEEQQSGWLDRNMEGIFQKTGIPPQSSILPACITTVYDESPQSVILYRQSKQALETLLKNIYDTKTIPFPLDLPSTLTAGNLIAHCQLSDDNATRLVEKFKLPKQHFNVVLFGEAGAGKSSVINLLSGHPVAAVSGDINSCTLAFSCYDVDIGSHQLRVWDTVGFNGTHTTEQDMIWKAVDNAVQLICSLCNQGGVDLLVFCKKSGRCTPSEPPGFKLFHEFLCEGRIPVAFIITNLEHTNTMEEWWKENEAGLLKTFGLKPGGIAGHACITSLSLKDANDQTLRDKILLSKQLIQTMLEDAISYGDPYMKSEEPWLASFFKGFSFLVQGLAGKKITVEKIKNQCGLSKEHAKELHKLLSKK